MLAELVSICFYVFLFVYSLAFSGRFVKFIVDRKELYRIILEAVRVLVIIGTASMLYAEHIWGVYKLIAICGMVLISTYVWLHKDIH